MALAPNLQKHRLSVLRPIGRGLTTVAVLAGFGGLWYMGHKTHWSVPGRGQAKAEAEASRAEAEAGTDVPGERPDRFAPVRFASEDEVRSAGLRVAAARSTQVEEAVTANAEVGYNLHRVAQLSCRVPGHVYSIHARLGDKVKAGDLLALIDSQEVGRAKANFLQEVFLAWYKADVLDRYRAVGGGVIPERTIREAEVALKEAELRRFTAQQRLLNLGLTPPDTEKPAASSPEEFARAIQFLGIPETVIASFRPRPRTANLIPLLAPFDGIVTRQEVVVGEMVSPDKEQFVVADVSSMWVNIAVRKEDARRLRLGQPVRFLTSGLADPVTGKLDWIGSEVDQKTRTVRARCEVANPRVKDPTAGEGGRLLRANLFGTATVVTAKRPAIVVPDAAVQRMPDGTPVVFVRQSDGLTYDPRPVRVGRSAGGATEIAEGVAAGEVVVTDGSYVLKSELMKDGLVGD